MLFKLCYIYCSFLILEKFKKMEIIKFVWDNLYLRYVSIVIIIIIVYVFLDSYIIHKKNIKKGIPSAFFWSKSEGKLPETNNEEKSKTVVTAKNVNTGINHGKIGDN